MRIAVLGGGPAACTSPRWPSSSTPGTRSPSGSATRRRHVRLRRGVLRRDARRHRARRPGDRARAMRREFARWDDIDVHYRGTVITSGGHGFAAMSRKRLLGILQSRCAELGVEPALPHRGTGRRRRSARVRPGGRRRRGQLGDPRAGSPRRSGPSVETAPVPVHLARHRPGLRRLQVLHPRDAGRDHADPRLPVRPRRQHVHPRDARRRVAARRLRPHRERARSRRAERRDVDRR